MTSYIDGLQIIQTWLLIVNHWLCVLVCVCKLLRIWTTIRAPRL